MGGGADRHQSRDALHARTRAGLALGAFIGGLQIGLHTPGAPVGIWFALAIASCAVALPTRGRAAKLALLLAVLLLGAGWMQGRIHTLAPNRIELLGLEPGVRISQIEGVVASPMVHLSAPPTALDPPRGGARPGVVQLELKRAVSRGEWVPLSGRVALVAPGLRDAHVRAGQRVRCAGRLTLFDQSASNAWAGARRRGSASAGYLSVPDVSLIETVPARGMLSRVVARIKALRGDARRRAARALGSGPETSDARALMLALLLGRMEGGVNEIFESFQRTGAMHLMAISGFHLAVIGSMALWLVRLSGERGRSGALVAGLIVAYLFVLPARIPIVRAGVMLLSLFVMDAIGRRHDRLAVLAWVAIGVLVWRPFDAAGLGFILSFGITALLVWLSGSRHPWVFGRPGLRGTLTARAGPARGAWMSLRGFLVVCLLCWLTATPAIMCQTGRFSPIGTLACALLTPVITIDLGLGFLVAIFGSLWPALGDALSGVLDVAGGVTLSLVWALDRVPGASSATPLVSPLWAAGATLCVIGALRDAARERRWLGARHIAAGAVVLLWLAWQLAGAGRLADGVAARIDTIDVGDGTCHVLRAGEHALLWDAGSLSRSRGERMIRDRLAQLGIWRVRTAVISHPNLDHYNVLPGLAEPLGLERVLVGDAVLDEAARDPEGALAITLDAIRREGVEVERIGAGATLRLGGATLRVLSDGWGDPALSANDRSLVARLETPTRLGERRVLLTGDIQQDAMERLVSEGADVRAEVIELPHHGSVHEAAIPFVERTGTSVVLQSTGRSRAVDPRWNSAREGRVWLETSSQGSVWAEILSDGRIRAGASRP